jgi:outer membrane biogenesis lipoprotein LolB
MRLSKRKSKSVTAWVLSLTAMLILIAACSDQMGKDAAKSMHKTIEQPEVKIKEANDQHQKQLEAGIEAANKGASAPQAD